MKSFSHDGWLVTEFKNSDGTDLQLVKHLDSGKQFERPVSPQSISAQEWLGLIEQAEASLTRPPQDYIRWAIRLLAMVGELHKLGFQRLRIMPYMAPSGMYWRCGITTVDNIKASYGAVFANYSRPEVTYSSGSENTYFDWADAKKDSARELAAKFMIRFPDLTQHGRGHDWAYAGWYQYMLGIAERGDVPVAFREYDSSTDYLPTTGLSKGAVRLLMPPGGEARDQH